jgi:hypothetical protein
LHWLGLQVQLWIWAFLNMDVLVSFLILKKSFKCFTPNNFVSCSYLLIKKGCFSWMNVEFHMWFYSAWIELIV